MERLESRPLVIPALVLGICLMLGLIVGGLVLGGQIKEMKLADRYVTVKGLVERRVKSDTALWSISFTDAGNDLSQVFAKSEADKDTVLRFLTAQGITAEEVTVGQIQVTDTQANQYNQNRPPNRYILQQTLTVRSLDVDKIARAGQKTAALVQAGIILQNGGQIGYKFNGLNALKPDMITEATRNARASADRFAADSGSQVGSIRSAKQGVFSISAADSGSAPAATDEAPAYSDPQADSSIMKNVRVVATVDYYLVR